MRPNSLTQLASVAAMMAALIMTACDPSQLLKSSCRDDKDCLNGNFCGSDMMCAPIPVDAGPPNDHAAAGDGAPDAEPNPPPTDCNQVHWDPVTVASSGGVPPLLAGRWSRCGGSEPVNLQSPFEFTDDGHWYLLRAESDGSFTRLDGFGQAGTYTVPRPDRLVILSNSSSPGSTLESNIAFSLSPRLMQYGPALYSALP